MPRNLPKGYDKGKRINGKVVKRLLSYVSGTYKFSFAIVLVCILISTLAGVAGSMRRFILEHTFVDQRPLRFDGTGGQFLGNSLVIFLLSVVTLGIYGILCAGNARIIHWDGEHTIVPIN